MSTSTNESKVILKDIDGSLTTEPKEGTKIVFIDYNYQLQTAFYLIASSHLFLLMEGRIFLLTDQELAKKKRDMLRKQLEITHEIKRLNAEENFNSSRMKFSDFEYHFFDIDFNNLGGFDFNEEITIKSIHYRFDANRQYMSKKTANYIYNKYSQEELKQYLGYIIN